MGNAYADMVPSAGIPLSQVTAVDHPAGFAFADRTYGLDAVGNRTQMVDGGTTAYVANALNQYTQVSPPAPAAPIAPTYDASGNLTSDGATAYSYDAENRLISGTRGATAFSYTYDPFGRRISKTVDGVTTRFLYDGDQIIAETDSAGNLTAKYLYGTGIDEPMRMERGGTVSYYHADGLGSIVALTDLTGVVVERYSYDLYGAPQIADGSGAVIPESSIGNCFLFTGREWDAESGLYHFRARTYSPSLGRFLQRDPVGYSTGPNLYTYVDNNPLNFTDPLGETPLLAIGVGITIFGGILGGVIGGIEAYQGGESILAGAGRGFLQGAVASGMGVLTTLITRNPAAIGAVSGFFGNLTSQGFDIVTQGKTFNAGRLVGQTVLSAALGPLVRRTIPLQGRRPDLFKLRSLWEFARPNTQRLFRQASLGTLLKSVSNAFFGAFGPDIQKQIERDVFGGDGTENKK